jgi:transcriptional regulator with XRE-family HTH domain
MSEAEIELARNIKRLREERGWSQAELARRSNMNNSIVSLIENAKRNPSTKTLGNIAGALGVELGDLFSKACRSSRRKRAADERPVYSFSEAIRDAASTWKELVEGEGLEFDERMGRISTMIELAGAIREQVSWEQFTRLPANVQDEISQTTTALTEAAHAGLRQSERALEDYVTQHEVEDAREQIRQLTELTEEISA